MSDIRRAQLDDHDALIDLWIDAGLGRASEAEWNTLIAHPAAVVFVAVDGEDVVGTAIASFDGWRAYIYHVAVAGGRRRGGIARALMQEAEDHLFREGAGAIYVMVHEGNTAGLALSGALGYLPDGDLVLVKEASG